MSMMQSSTGGAHCIKVLSLLALSLEVFSFCNAFVIPTSTTTTSTEGYSTRNFSSLSLQQKIVQEKKTTCSSATELNLFFGGNGNSNLSKKNNGSSEQVPYIIESIDTYLNQKVFDDVANLCIDVFFKEQMNNAKPDERIAPWKEAQISYLKMLQAGDLKRRRQRYPKSNKMLIAYEVLPTDSNNVNSGLWKRRPLILDLDQVQNLSSDQRTSGQEFVKGQPLGFVEITQRPYGLGGKNEFSRNPQETTATENEDGGIVNGGDDNDAASSNLAKQLLQKRRMQQQRLKKQQQAIPMTMRPVLTNLAVSYKARKSGIGSKLVDECEKHVQETWDLKEIILEVEDFNEKALNFYQKRGYDVLFSDPASRRYDVTGVLLRKIRCTREIMRKSLSSPFAVPSSSSPALNNNDRNNVRASELFQKLRDTVGAFELIK